MGLLLHLSDLHLADDDHDYPTGDYKTETIPTADRQARRRTLEATLTSLGRDLRSNGRGLDAVVITGDITYQHSESGFRLLEPTLAKLGKSLPPRDRIVVVPGNHDVLWGARPASPERYASFVRWVRDRGFRTPLLDGIDYAGGRPKAAADPILDCANAGFVIVALNTADYCGVVDQSHPAQILGQRKYDKLLADIAASGIGSASLLREWLQQNRFEDMARISQRQLDAVRTRLGRLSSPRPLVVAALHHHLLPVSASEEIKRYADLMNLGQVREFLTTWCDLVLHGHKHTSRIYNDRFDVVDVSTRTRQECLVSSSGTTGTGQYNVPARLLDVTGDERGGTVTIKDVPAVGSGADVAIAPRGTWIVTSKKTLNAEIGYVGRVARGDTIDETYRAVSALFTAGTRTTTDTVRFQNFTCIVEHGESCLTPPEEYPEVSGRETNWFIHMVDWWQASVRPPGSVPFNHGERLRRYSGWLDQVERAVKILASTADTTRATLTLLEPARDLREGAKFPAFSLLEAMVIDDQVHCTGLFRKQEMHYWWPINMAELARIQNELVSRLRSATGRSIAAGRIVTATSLAVYSEQPPKVAIPLVDRLIANGTGQTRLVAMAQSATESKASATAASATALADWKEVIAAWRPAEARSPDGDPVTIDGTRTLARLLAHFEGVAVSRAKSLSRLVDEVASANEAYDRVQGDPHQDVDRARHAWIQQVEPPIADIARLIRRRLGAS